MAAPEDRMPWLGPLLVARDAAGQRLYTDEQAEDFLAALVLSQGVGDPAQLPGGLAELLVRFAARAQVPDGADRPTADARVAAYFAQHPVPEALKRDFGARYRAMLTDLDPSALADAYARIAPDRVPLTKEAPAKDGLRGALGFFAAQEKLKK